MKVRLSTVNWVDFVLTQTGLQMKKHSAFFSYFGFFYGILYCRLSRLCGSSGDLSRGEEEDHIFAL